VLALFLAVLGVVVLPAAPAAACDCVGDAAAGSFARADLVFTGTLVSREVSHPHSPVLSSTDPALHVFAVDSVFKGSAAQRQGVVSADSGASCGLELSGDGPFVVFANREGAQYTASLCGGSAPLTAALEADLRALGPAAAPSAGPSRPSRPSPAARTGASDVPPVGGSGSWPWPAGGAVVLAGAALAWGLRRRVLSGK
jgi:hypothetical protein